MYSVVRTCVFVLLPMIGFAQADSIRSAMEASIEKQRASIRTQMSGAVPVSAAPVGQSSPFFTISWPKPVAMLSTNCDPLPKQRVDELVTKAASQEGLKPDLIREVMLRESAFRPCAVSVKGAEGLMQLMPATAQQFGVKDSFDPEQNVNAGAKLLKQLMAKYKDDLSLTLAAYNSGSGTVDRANGVPEIAETQAYVKEILKKLIL